MDELTLFLTFLSLLWKGKAEDGDCYYSYFTYNYDSMDVTQTKEYLYCDEASSYCCGSFQERSCCYYTVYEEGFNPSIGLVFGGLTGLTMVVVLCACICAKLHKQPSAANPSMPCVQVQSTFSSNTSGSLFTVSNTVPEQNHGSNPVTTNTLPPSYQVAQDYSMAPPSYEECLAKQLIIPPTAVPDNEASNREGKATGPYGPNSGMTSASNSQYVDHINDADYVTIL